MTKEKFVVELTEFEMFQILNSLELMAEKTSEEKAKLYKALFDRLETIFEGRE